MGPPLTATAAPRWRRESDSSWTGAALGEGEVPLQDVYETLKAGGYRGYVSVEYEGPDDPRPAVRTGTEYIRRLERSA